MLIIRNTLTSGRVVGMAAVLGVQLGLAVHLSLALAGIGFFIVKIPQLYTTVVVVGAVYLAWLGAQSFLMRGSMQLQLGTKSGWRTSAISAMTTNLLNPKVLAMFLAVLPGFVTLDAAVRVELQLLILVIMLIAVNTLWQSALVVFCDSMSRWLLRPTISAIVARITGSIFIVFAVLMLYEHSWN